MKLALTLEADSINVQALNMGRIVVDVDGVNLAELINVVCDNGYSFRVVDESDRTSAERTPPSAALTGIRCSTAHITAKDNAWLYSLSHQTNDYRRIRMDSFYRQRISVTYRCVVIPGSAT